MLRILHTADWHLGAHTEGVSREEDHARFLAWLAGAVREHGAHALVVAGDVFDQVQPSAEAQRLYYGFLRAVAGRVRKVVIVGGNHDSAARLEAPREILETLDVHVVGGLPPDVEGPDGWERCLCPIPDGRGRTAAMVLAVPFVHEFRLGVRTALASAEEIGRACRERFAALYRRLADMAEARAPGVPIIATGHLACAGTNPNHGGGPVSRSEMGGVREKPAPADVPVIGTLGGLPPYIFDPRIEYVALGHIHRSYRVGKSRAWYPGSPVALDAEEGRTPRRVLLVELEGAGRKRAAQRGLFDDGPSVTPIEVPAARAVLAIRGTPTEVAERLRTLECEGELPPLVYATVDVECFSVGLEAELARAAEANPRAPRIVEVRQELARAPDGEAAVVAPGVSLRDLTPEEVFERLCRARGEPVDEALLGAFRSLLGVEERGARPRPARIAEGA